MGKALIRMRVAHWDEIRAGAIARGEEPPPELTPEERRLAAEGNYNVEHSPEMTAHLSLTAVPDLACILADFARHAVHFDGPRLLTSKHPVNYWRPPEPSGFRRLCVPERPSFPMCPGPWTIWTDRTMHRVPKRYHGPRRWKIGDGIRIRDLRRMTVGELLTDPRH
jgi:hypothetical protein